MNAPSPIVVTLSGIVTDVRLLQPLNAEFPILVTLSGIVTDVRLRQPSNVHCLIEVISDGIVISVTSLLSIYNFAPLHKGLASLPTKLILHQDDMSPW